MAGRGPQTFKKRQKEQQRKEKQLEKRAKKLERKRQGPNPDSPDDPFNPDDPFMGESTADQQTPSGVESEPF